MDEEYFFFTHTTLEFLNTVWSNWEIASVTRGRCRVLLCFPSLYLCCVQIFFIFHRQHSLKTTLLYNVPDFTSSSHSINPITTQRSVYTFKLLFLVPQIPFSALPYRFGFIGSSDVSHFSHENVFIRVSTDCVPGPVSLGCYLPQADKAGEKWSSYEMILFTEQNSSPTGMIFGSDIQALVLVKVALL